MRPVFDIKLILAVLFLFAAPAGGGSMTGDSLRAYVGNKEIHDTTKINRFIEIAEKLSMEFDSNAIKFYALADSFTKIAKLDYFSFNTNNLMGIWYYNSGKNEEALVRFLEAERIARKIHDSIKLNKSYNNLAIVYDELAAYNISLKYYLKTIEIDKALNDSAGLSIDYSNLGALYATLGNNEKARDFLKRAKQLAIKYNNYEIQYNCELTLAAIYINEGKNDKALECLKTAIDITKKRKDFSESAVLLTNFGYYYQNKKDYVEAEKYFKHAISLSKKQNKTSLWNSASLDLAYLYMELGDSLTGMEKRKHLKKAVAGSLPTIGSAKKNSDVMSELAAYDILRKAYKGLDDYKNAFKYNDLYINLSDTIHKKQLKNELENIAARMDAEKKIVVLKNMESELKLQRIKTKNRSLITSIIGTLLGFSFLFLFIIFRMFLIKKKSNEDISKKMKEIEVIAKELKSSNEIKDTFFKLIAHDLRSPFNTLLGFSKILEDKAGDYNIDEVKRFASIINNLSRDTYDLLNNLLQWAGLQTDTLEFNPQLINVNSILEQTLQILSYKASAKNIKIINNLNDDIQAYTETNILDTVFRNLISNSIKFTQSGFVEISSFSKDSMVYISIKDSGSGILPENIRKMLNANIIYSTPGTNNEKGTGFGFNLCKQLIELGGGTISIDSRPGKGTKIIFSLRASE
ncbi:MAG: sensor histidine kinase [Chlorobi bacterium]|nr:sensor histidine kinase [Chlorobiota bacterium]